MDTHKKAGKGTCEIAYCHDISLICEGENIDTITYSINTGYFLVQQPDGANIILDGEKTDITDGERTDITPGKENEENVIIEPSDSEYTNYSRERYTSYTVAADNQEDESTIFSVAGRSMISDADCHLLFGHNTKESIDDRQAHINRTMREMTSVKNKILNDIIITAQIKYKDGSTQEAKIQLGAACKTCEELWGAETCPEDVDKLVSVTTYKLL